MICWEDVDNFDIGADPSGRGFEKIANLMLSGDYYQDDVINFEGPFRDELRDLKPGDQVTQKAPIVPLFPWPLAKSVVEIFVAERSEKVATIGYVTTVQHHARGKWSARLTRENEILNLTVSIIVCPRSWLFWIGLPYARWLQVRAKRQAVSRFRSIITKLES